MSQSAKLEHLTLNSTVVVGRLNEGLCWGGALGITNPAIFSSMIHVLILKNVRVSDFKWLVSHFLKCAISWRKRNAQARGELRWAWDWERVIAAGKGWVMLKNNIAVGWISKLHTMYLNTSSFLNIYELWTGTISRFRKIDQKCTSSKVSHGIYIWRQSSNSCPTAPLAQVWRRKR